MKTTDFDVIFDNGGNTILQTAHFCHMYDYGSRAAEDVKVLLDGGNTSDWEGNQPECRVEYDLDVARNGGYCWHTQDRVRKIITIGKLDVGFGRNMDEFYRRLGVTIP
jgi:hypothetical protein